VAEPASEDGACMRTQISPGNPYGLDRFGFAWEHLPVGGRAHLDFGCFDGRFLASLGPKNIPVRVGADVSREAVALARKKCPELPIVRVAEAAPLPFADGAFTSITLLEVLEHVAEQKKLLGELGRVLAPDGRLIVSVPRRHVFSMLDLGNLKFLFPRLHRWFYSVRHSREQYERRYAANPDGLVGDVSARKRWHEHFTPEHLAELLGQAGFEVVSFDGSGLFARPLFVLFFVPCRIRLFRRLLDPLYRLDARHFESMNLFCLARKKSGPA
jgi:SAM-dependent methyltransferase